jgi:DNA-directed RNA polymerase subunit RPC12/RpoP
MIESTQGRGKGQWWPRTDGAVTYYCDKCGQPMSLAAHTLSEDGEISPSVVCPYPLLAKSPWGEVYDARSPTADCKSCGFHNMLKLIGWRKP